MHKNSLNFETKLELFCGHTVYIFSAEPATTEKLSTSTVTSRKNPRRFRSFRSRTKYRYVEPTVSIVSAPPKVIKHGLDDTTTTTIPEDTIDSDSEEMFDNKNTVVDHTDAVTDIPLMFISAPPKVFGTQEKDFDDFEYENFETKVNFETETNDDETGHIDVNFEDLDQQSEWIESLDLPKIQKSQPLKILVVNCTKNDTMDYYFDDYMAPETQMVLSINISIFLCVTGMK